MPASQSSDSSASSTPQRPTAKAKAAPPKTPPKAARHTAARKKRRSPRVQRMHQAFVASASLKPMAQQLLQERTAAGYAGVEAYAKKHAKEDAGALAWLVVGYAHVLDHDYAKAVDPLNRAKSHAGDLGDYVAYYLGSSYLQTGRSAEAVATLASFGQTNPDSLVIKDAHVVCAGALIAEGRAMEAAALLEKDREPARADVELGLGRAYAATGQTAKALAALRNVYFNMPTSPEADTALTELHKLGGVAPAGLSDRWTRADLLAKGKRYSDAASEYQDLLDEVSPAERSSVQLALAGALQKSGRNKDAKQILNSVPESIPEIAAQRLFLLGEVARATDDNDGFLRLEAQLRQMDPASPWLEQSLLAAGNMYLLKRDYDRAIDAYRELQQRFSNGSRASYAHWKVAWLTLRQGRNADAAQQFEQQIALYPSSAEVPAALYWRARLAEEDNEPAKARAYYLKISDRFRNFYYAELARQRLKVLPTTIDPVEIALLDHVPPLYTGSKVVSSDPPADDLHVQKAQLLENGGLVDFAVREVQATANMQDGTWALAETARLYQDSGRYDRAIQVMKRGVPNYFAVDVPELPRSYWEALFPKAYWGDLKRFSTQNGLDPYLVASLIRQESEFNPNAISHANAVGLMQLLPVTGKKVAKDVKLRHFNASQLYTPTVNLELGTRYFKTMVDKFGSFEYALAAYNAGSDRVEDWLSQGKYRDPQEFVESIPFTETREYVQAILRNANVYKQLYGTP
ncbi:MAG TPA: transglycosylase SLT domain-containing protein [Terriglobales bacterium]|nr:transglycosylase SLT domain-containing protein [Terriglobales bacterium]